MEGLLDSLYEKPHYCNKQAALGCDAIFCVEHRTWQGQALPLRSLKRDCGSVERSGDPCGRQAPRNKMNCTRSSLLKAAVWLNLH